MSWIAPGPKWTQEPLTIEEPARRTILLSAKGRHILTIEGWFKSQE